MIDVAEPDERPHGAGDWWWLGALAVLPWLLYHAALSFWWADDDLEILRYLREHGHLQYLFSPSAWRVLPGSVLTPLQFLSLHADLALAGMSPGLFRVHQLTTVSLAALALYWALRQWWRPGLAGSVATLFLLGRPVASLAAMVSARHYLEAIAFGAAALVCFRRAVLRDSVPAAWLAAGLSLTAMLFKETAVPLPFALAVLPIASWAARRRALLPQALALALYTVYRFVILGPELLRGYGFIVPPSELPLRLVALPGRVAMLFAGPWPWSAAGLLCLAAGLTVLAILRRPRLALLAWAAALALGPIIPVSTDLGERYALTLWIVAVVTVGAATHEASRRGGGWKKFGLGLLAVTLGVFAALNRPQWDATVDAARRSDAESRALLALGDGDVLRHPVAMGAFLGELQRYRAEILGVPGTPVWFQDDLALCRGRFSERRLWEFDSVSRTVVDESARRAEICRAACGTVRDSAPLAVELELRAEGLYWSLGGGAAGGRYGLVFEDGLRAFEVPARGGFHLPRPAPLRLRVRYVDPSGWRTYSEELALAGTPGERVRWQRPSGKP